jgi:putative peptidoglycan lipid II flippase
LGIVLLVPIFGVPGLGMGVVLGAAAHLGLQFGAAASRGFNFDPSLACIMMQAKLGSGVRRVLTLSFPRMIAISLNQLTLMALVAIGSLLAAGSVAVFSAAQDLYFVPIGIFGVSYATALFPRLSRAAVRGSGEEFLQEFSVGVRSILFWVAPSSALFLVLRAHIVRVALGAGAFSWEDTRLTAAVLAALAVSMAAVALQTLLIRGFYAIGNTRLPLAVNAVASLVSIGLALGISTVLSSSAPYGRGLAALFRIGDLPHPEVLGLGIGFAAGAIVNTVLLYFLLMRRALKVSSAASGGACGAEVAKIISAAIAAAGVAYLVRASFSETLPLITFARVLGQGLAAAAAGAAAYAAILTALGSQELRMLRRSITKGLFSVGILPKSWDGERITGN